MPSTTTGRQARSITCKACGEIQEYRKHGQLPRLCTRCSSTLRWCPKCQMARPLDDFYESQGPGSRCIPCCARPAVLYLCGRCGREFARTNRGGIQTSGRAHLCDECEVLYKWCSACGQILRREEFAVAKNKSGGRVAHCKPCRRAKYAKRTVRDRRRTVARKYGMTEVEWDAMYLAQGGLCAICGQPPRQDSRGLVVDHDHETGEVRALLCGPCNVGLGHFLDNPALLRQAANYLERWASSRAGDHA